ncbi:MAG: metal ABC transporter permease [Gemmatimonadales bacterium]|nr:MAG: metal ABC transporter permease [Gemmatimonadales bacterium]
MSLGAFLHDLLFDYTLRTVALGTAALGAVAGALGCFAVLRRQSLLGDAIAHAALPGIGLAFLLTGSRATPVLVLGAALAGWLGTLAILAIVRSARLPEDTALGIVLSVFFGAGLVILTFVQRRPTAAQAGLETFLFGQAATLLVRDVQFIAGVGAMALLLLFFFWKEFKILAFDPDFAASLGLPVRRLDVFLTSLLVVAIVLGLQAVGVVLMSALVVAPAAAARQWTDSLRWMVLLGGALGAVAGVTGASISAMGRGIPTGPTVVLVASGIVAVSLLAAPGRGLVAEWIRTRRTRTRVRADSVLADLYALGSQHSRVTHPHAAATLRAMASDPGEVERSLQLLEARGWARSNDQGLWALTQEGAERAERLFRSGSGEEEAT